ncbi:MAG: cation:proton antiporter [Candidatus Eremiobacterota bacterium]
MDPFAPASLLVVLLLVALAPLATYLPLPVRFPCVVVELLLGIAAGPYGLGLLAPGPMLDALSAVGMCMLFFMAGFELELDKLRGAPIGLAGRGWLGSLALALAASGLLWLTGLVQAPLLVGVALCTTAMGTLVPIMREADEIQRPFGRFVLAAGAMGEFGPIVLVSLLAVRDSSEVLEIGLLVLYLAVMLGAAYLALRVRPPRLVGVLQATMHSASQLPVRLSILLLATLVLSASDLGLDFVLGAFGAGMILALASRGPGGEPLRHKLDGLGFGFLVPILFVSSGVRFHLGAFHNPQTVFRMGLFLGLFLVCRGLPAWLYRRHLDRSDRWALALYSSTALPLVVAISEIGLATGRMHTDNAAALVGAGMLSVLVFPAVAGRLRRTSG